MFGSALRSYSFHSLIRQLGTVDGLTTYGSLGGHGGNVAEDHSLSLPGIRKWITVPTVSDQESSYWYTRFTADSHIESK